MEKRFSNFTFYMPTEIVFGKDAELQVADYVKKYGGTKVLIVMDGGGFIKASGLFDRIVDVLTKANISYVELEGVQPNPNASLVYVGLDLVKKEGVDFVLAIGGGSTVDTAKAIALGMVDDGDVMDFFTHKRRPQKMGPVGAISTIAASGSETSGSAMIKNDLPGGDGLKGGFMNNAIRTRFALMNPELTYTVPSFQTAAGATDIFAHTFDSYLTYETSYLADQYCEGTMRTAVKFGPIAVKDPTNYEARAELLLNSSFSHNDVTRIGRGKLSATSHFLEEALGNVFHRTHGAGLAVVMPACLQLAIDKDEQTIDRVAQLATNVFDVPDDPENRRAVAQEGINRFRAWLDDMGMPSTIREYAKVDTVTEEQLDELVGYVKFDHDGNFFGFGRVHPEDVKEMFRSLI
ncbi:iron-containing alcohol dehydrogenase [Floccifex sp.]|uniref:iron-containing alcohol dehydrogenase n=1 Tax=Floccifex sp. TaxID=2815810 RepID=UPI003F0EB85D